jgi:hypothetical protein
MGMPMGMPGMMPPPMFKPPPMGMPPMGPPGMPYIPSVPFGPQSNLLSMQLAQQQAEQLAAAEHQAQLLVGYTLAISLVQDKMSADAPDLWPLLPLGDVWVMELGTGDMRLHNVLEALQIPHKVITLEQFPLAKIYPSQTIYMNCWDENQAAILTEDMIHKMVQFVSEGGQLISFNCGIRILERCFPGYVAASEKRVGDYTAARISLAPQKEDQAMKIYGDVTLECILEPGARAVKVVNKEAVTVLATLPPALLGERVAGCKFTVQNGTVYHVISELTERERVSSEPKRAIGPYLKHHAASPSTVFAWQCAGNCGYENAFSIGMSAYPFIYFVSRVALQQKARYKDWKPPPEPMMPLTAAGPVPMPIPGPIADGLPLDVSAPAPMETQPTETEAPEAF